jgi:chromate reductase
MTATGNQTPRDIAVIVGSLRKESLNRKLAVAMQSLSPAELQLELVEIGDLPLYNQDLEANVPASWARLRARLVKADGFLFVTPEYNRSLPSALKNAIDVGSRPYGKSSWENKPGAIVSVSPGGMGAFGANHHLRQSLVFLNVFAMAQPEAYIGGADKLFGDAGHLTSAPTREFLTKYLQKFAEWVSRHTETR